MLTRKCYVGFNQFEVIDGIEKQIKPHSSIMELKFPDISVIQQMMVREKEFIKKQEQIFASYFKVHRVVIVYMGLLQ